MITISGIARKGIRLGTCEAPVEQICAK